MFYNLNLLILVQFHLFKLNICVCKTHDSKIHPQSVSVVGGTDWVQSRPEGEFGLWFIKFWLQQLPPTTRDSKQTSPPCQLSPSLKKTIIWIKWEWPGPACRRWLMTPLMALNVQTPHHPSIYQFIYSSGHSFPSYSSSSHPVSFSRPLFIIIIIVVVVVVLWSSSSLSSSSSSS